jgi:predicted pyridoxine 5'-phosphate oxidase superfamily flavin-nucleotide-binding protein
MTDHPTYNSGSRRLQDQFDSRRIADRLEQVTFHTTFSDGDRAFIESRAMFFLATADADGRPDCSYKGGLPGFVRVLDERTLAWPDYDGNGQFRSLGNAIVNPHVGLLFIDWERPRRMRVNGDASVSADDPVRVAATQIFPNCPRYIHRMQQVEQSAFAPRADYQPPRPGWKDDPSFADALPRKDLKP